MHQRNRPLVVRHLFTDWPIVRTLEGERNPLHSDAAVVFRIIATVAAVALFAMAVGVGR